MSDEEFEKGIKERLFSAKNSDSNTKLWLKIWATLCIAFFFCGIYVGATYYSIKMNSEVQYALDIIGKQKMLDSIPPELEEMFLKYDVNTSRNHSGEKHIMKIENCDYNGCKELN